jgi:large subunit ribosomal protein L17e
LLQARGSDLRVHFKNSREAGKALKGLTLNKAKVYMQAVIDHKRCVPFLRYNGELLEPAG